MNVKCWAAPLPLNNKRNSYSKENPGAAFAIQYHGDMLVQINLPYSGNAKVAIHDLQGKVLMSLWEGYLDPGEHAISISQPLLPFGAYIVKVSCGSSQWSDKLMLMHK
jgi:hypothetical protein